MWDCHSCDPGSNPGPGVQPSIRIPTSIDFKNNNNNNNKNEHNNFEIDSRLLIQKNNNNNNDNYKDAKLFENNQM